MAAAQLIEAVARSTYVHPAATQQLGRFPAHTSPSTPLPVLSAPRARQTYRIRGRHTGTVFILRHLTSLRPGAPTASLVSSLRRAATRRGEGRSPERAQARRRRPPPRPPPPPPRPPTTHSRSPIRRHRPPRLPAAAARRVDLRAPPWKVSRGALRWATPPPPLPSLGFLWAEPVVPRRDLAGGGWWFRQFPHATGHVEADTVARCVARCHNAAAERRRAGVHLRLPAGPGQEVSGYLLAPYLPSSSIRPPTPPGPFLYIFGCTRAVLM